MSRKAPATPMVVNVWPGKVPGDPGIDMKDDERRRGEGWLWSTPPDNNEPGEEYGRYFRCDIPGLSTLKIITNVSKPTLTIYKPAEDKNTGTAMLVCPGGGYHNLLWELEGEDVAKWLASVGITGIVLKYRVPRRANEPGFGDPSPPSPTGPTLDVQRAVSLVRSRAKEWSIHPQRIGVVGFSAGGHLAIMAATKFENRAYDAVDAIDEVSCRPNFSVACYPGYLKAKDKDEIEPSIRIPPNTPPILLAHASDDRMSNAEHSVFMYLALKRAGMSVELHCFASGDHDFGVRHEENLLPSSWTQLLLNWLRDRGVLAPQSKA